MSMVSQNLLLKRKGSSHPKSIVKMSNDVMVRGKQEKIRTRMIYPKRFVDKPISVKQRMIYYA